MYELWARKRETCKDVKLASFTDKNQFHFMIDQVDREEYSDATIIEWVPGDSLPHCAFYVEFKTYGNIKRRVR